jgi:hypothetical protein
VNRRILVAALSAWIPFAGCGSPRQADGWAQLTGTVVDTRITETGDVPDPYGPDDVHLSVVCPGPHAWSTIAATIDQQGAFTVTDVPSRDCYLKMEKQFEGSWPVFVRAATDHIDLGGLYLGRADVAVATQPSVLEIDSDRMTAWHPNDELDLFSLGAGVTAYGIEKQANMAPADGDTALRGFAVDLTKLPDARVVDGDRGDHLYVTHFRRTMLPVPYDSIEETLAAPAPALQEGQSAAISDPFQTGSTTDVRIDWRETAFFAQRTNVNPQAHVDVDYIAIYADPAGPRRTTDGPLPVLMFSGFRPGDVTPADVPFTAPIVNPYPASWTPRYCAESVYSFDWLPPDVKESIVSCGTAAATIGPVVPAITPPRHLQIDGKDIAHPFQQSGPAPTLRWDPPPEHASMYTVTIRQQAPDQTWPIIGAIVTDLTAVPFPPGLLAPDQPWVATVTAFAHASLAAPSREPGNESFAAAVSARLMP